MADLFPAHDPYSALRVPNYRNYLLGSFCSLLGRQAVGLAVTWEIYQWTHSATALGLVGFVNILPLFLLSLPAGALADRYDRRRIIACGSAGSAILGAALALLAIFHSRVPALAPLVWANAGLRHVALVFERHVDPSLLHFDEPALPLLFLLLFAIAVVRILIWPARSSLPPLLLPPERLSNAITWGASTFEIATITGPAVGGFLIAWGGFSSVCWLSTVLELGFLGVLVRLKYFASPPPTVARRTWRDMLAGAEFIWNRKVILGASGLDLFAVLLGGATTLLPIYADEILHVGPIGLGWLRAAPSIGAVAMAMWLAHRAPMKHPGRALLWTAAGFGVAIIVFGFSPWFWLSLIALFVTGVCDNVSVVVRQSLVQLLTPNHLRGRVTAVNQIFIGSSNEIGALRAGLMAALLGPVGAVIWGGLGTIAVTAIVARLVPPLRRLPALHTLRPDG